ncbi:hypothetical protein M2163_008774 [Streptomyces sp. SAI-135]|nr:hypothetical protein [Streptomyces sp. SAI-090]MDH6621666.1 hypothetical protein [Streptomyces sp. SAI-135]
MLTHDGVVGPAWEARRWPTTYVLVHGHHSVGAFWTLIGGLDRPGVLRLSFRTGDSRELTLLKEMICADHPDADLRRIQAGMQIDEPITACAGRAVGRADR